MIYHIMVKYNNINLNEALIACGDCDQFVDAEDLFEDHNDFWLVYLCPECDNELLNVIRRSYKDES